MNELALFAGAGGGILAGHLLGWRCVCAVERDSYCARRLMQRQNEGHLAPFPVWDDVRTFDGHAWRGHIDVVSGGFPCTDISPAGNLAGIEGDASGLWREMARIIGEVRPHYAFIENSANLINYGLERVLCDLAAIGMDARWMRLSAADLGASHKRSRVWIVAYPVGSKGSGPLRRSDFGVGRFGKPISWDGTKESTLAYARRNDAGLARRVERTNAIRNGQVPIVAATAWRILSE